MLSACTVDLFLMNHITVIIFGEIYQLWRSSLANILHLPVNFFLVCSNILFSTLFSKKHKSTFFCLQKQSDMISELMPRSSTLLEKSPVAQLLKNFPTFYGTRKFITVFTRTFHWSLFWARWIQFIPTHLISSRFVLLLSSHLLVCLSFLVVYFLPSYLPKLYMRSASPHAGYMPYQTHPPWLHRSNYIW
jgi:hypothetical protein